MARQDLLPEDNVLILNKKRKDYFPESEFNIDMLCEVLPLLMSVSPSIKDEESPCSHFLRAPHVHCFGSRPNIK
jgi:hypothetical protein